MSDENRMKDSLMSRLQYFLDLILLVHAVFFLVYWIAVGNFREDVDLFISNLFNFSLPYTTLLILFTALLGLWGLLRLIRLRFTIHKGGWKSSAWNWVFLGLALIFLILFYGGFMLILRENPAQRGVILSLLNLARLGGDALIFLLAGILLRRLILYLRQRMQTAPKRWMWTVGIIITLISLVGLWLLPTLFPPNWVFDGDLPAKPALLAHRGASMLAPENTLAAAELAAEYGAFGFETDVRISLDGVAFLMHDETLARTTNIAEIFPDRVNDPASSFTMEELNQLNAGLWFIQKDPFGTIDDGLVSQSQLAINQGQAIPTLSAALDLVDQEGLVILFDLRYPPQDHPYFDSFFEIVLNQCRESGLNEDIWFMVSQELLPDVIEQTPQFTRVIGASCTELPAAQALVSIDYEIVNVDTGICSQDIDGYRERGLGVNVYTVDQPWLFSQFWLSGVTSITTNNVHTISQMDRPVLQVPYSRYLLFWGLYGIFVAIWLASSQPKRAGSDEDQSDIAQEKPSQEEKPILSQGPSFQWETLDVDQESHEVQALEEEDRSQEADAPGQNNDG